MLHFKLTLDAHQSDNVLCLERMAASGSERTLISVKLRQALNGKRFICERGASRKDAGKPWASYLGEKK